jgi:hypothetical protein
MQDEAADTRAEETCQSVAGVSTIGSFTQKPFGNIATPMIAPCLDRIAVAARRRA